MKAIGGENNRPETTSADYKSTDITQHANSDFHLDSSSKHKYMRSKRIVGGIDAPEGVFNYIVSNPYTDNERKWYKL